MSPAEVKELAAQYSEISALRYHVDLEHWHYLTKWSPPIDTTSWLPLMYPTCDVRACCMFLSTVEIATDRYRFTAEIRVPRMEVLEQMYDDEHFDPAHLYVSKRLNGYGDIEFHIAKPRLQTGGDGFYDSPEWQRLRYQALELYGARCMACGRTAKNGVFLHVDHIKPRSRYPELALDINNLQVLCHECNLGKSNIYTTDWRP